jgi:DNA-directed RNA polymerase omega subunit
MSDEGAAAVGGSRFDLVLVATQRARAISRGSAPRLKTDNGPIVTALKEVEAGLYTKQEFLRKLQGKDTEE